MEKMTNVKAIGFVLENYAEELPTEVFDKLTAIKDSFVKKSENRKPTATQKANEELKKIILDVIGEEGVTASEVLAKVKAVDEKYADVSLPKITAQLTALKKAEVIDRIADKKKALYKIA